MLLTLTLDGEDQLTIPKAVQRHPIRGDYEHVDLIAVRLGERVTIDVPLVLTGHIAPGAMLGQEYTTVQVEAEATHLPTEIEVSIEGLDAGAHITAGDLNLPTGTTLVTDAETLLLNVVSAPTAEDIEADTAGAIAELGIVEEPADRCRRRRGRSRRVLGRTAASGGCACGAGFALATRGPDCHDRRALPDRRARQPGPSVCRHPAQRRVPGRRRAGRRGRPVVQGAQGAQPTSSRAGWPASRWCWPSRGPT